MQTDGQALVDRMQAEIRAGHALVAPPPARASIRRDPPPLEPALVSTNDPHKLRLAEDLEYARCLIEALGDPVCSDPLLVTRHAVPLQSIEVVGQMLGHLATVTRSSVPERAVGRIGMNDLRARLTRRSVIRSFTPDKG